MERIFAVWKPKGVTSHDMVDAVRRATGVKKVGHGGTLDPLATGVLVVGVGRAATKRLSRVVRSEKEYVATVELGATSETDDAEGPIDQNRNAKPVDAATIDEALKSFRGVIDQVPPMYSAVHSGGQKAYKKARAGQAVVLAPRKVELKELELLDYRWPILRLRLVTGSGFYVRALARDIGQKLGVGGYLKELERTRVGKFNKDDAIDINVKYPISNAKSNPKS